MKEPNLGRPAATAIDPTRIDPTRIDPTRIDPTRIDATRIDPTLIDLEIGPVAHGGHCVARTPAGQVVFVRHTVPGERVRARVTGSAGTAQRGFLRADAVEILEPSPDRVAPPCPYAGPGRCGGCDFQHVALPRQRELKADVVREQLVRLGGLSTREVADLDIRVQRVPEPTAATASGPGPSRPGGSGLGPDTGLGWRTRVRYTVGSDGRPGLLAHRSHEVIPVRRCLIAHPAIQDATVDGVPVLAREWPGLVAVEVVASGSGEVTVLGHRRAGRPTVRHGPAQITQTVQGRAFRLGPTAFWQIHAAAATILSATVVELLRPQPGERALDLYGGAGLFAAALAPRLGASGRVSVVEASAAAVTAARASLADLINVQVIASDVEQALAGRAGRRPTDLVVLDPPRAGAGRAVIEAILSRSPRAVAYVACDPAALARDLRTARAAGARLAQLPAFDLFPMTHHVECVALLELPARR